MVEKFTLGDKLKMGAAGLTSAVLLGLFVRGQLKNSALEESDKAYVPVELHQADYLGNLSAITNDVSFRGLNRLNLIEGYAPCKFDLVKPSQGRVCGVTLNGDSTDYSVSRNGDAINVSGPCGFEVERGVTDQRFDTRQGTITFMPSPTELEKIRKYK